MQGIPVQAYRRVPKALLERTIVRHRRLVAAPVLVNLLPARLGLLTLELMVISCGFANLCCVVGTQQFHNCRQSWPTVDYLAEFFAGAAFRNSTCGMPVQVQLGSQSRYLIGNLHEAPSLRLV